MLSRITIQQSSWRHVCQHFNFPLLFYTFFIVTEEPTSPAAVRVRAGSQRSLGGKPEDKIKGAGGPTHWLESRGNEDWWEQIERTEQNRTERKKRLIYKVRVRNLLIAAASWNTVALLFILKKEIEGREGMRGKRCEWGGREWNRN